MNTYILKLQQQKNTHSNCSLVIKRCIIPIDISGNVYELQNGICPNHNNGYVAGLNGSDIKWTLIRGARLCIACTELPDHYQNVTAPSPKCYRTITSPAPCGSHGDVLRDGAGWSSSPSARLRKSTLLLLTRRLSPPLAPPQHSPLPPIAISF